MAQRSLLSLFGSLSLSCRQCRSSALMQANLRIQVRPFATSNSHREELQIKAAKEIDLEKLDETPARIVPASPSYFTGSPVFNDNLLLLEQLLKDNADIPTLPEEHVPRIRWMTLSQYRSTGGERIAAAKYAKVTRILQRLNKIHPDLRTGSVKRTLARFQRPGAAEVRRTELGTIDEYGRSTGVGTRKESTARVFLVEGTGEVVINGKSIVQVFPRLHDRESALWALKISQRMDKYNVFAKVEGGGVTGQAESLTLAVARALLVQEPALKPALRRAGCVTFDARRVERKKPGRLKARKRPTWVKR